MLRFTIRAGGSQFPPTLHVRMLLNQTRGESKRGAAMQKVNLAEKFATFSEHWRPKVVGELNGQDVKIVKFQGA
jgi:hypothetical protein